MYNIMYIEETENISDAVAMEYVPMIEINILAVKKRICKAIMRRCLAEYNPHTQMTIDFRCSRVFNLINELTDDIFETFIDMSSPYNMTRPMDELEDCFNSMSMSVNNNPNAGSSSRRLYRFLEQNELWQICSADPMSEGTRGEQHIVRILELMALEEMMNHRVHYSIIREYFIDMNFYPDGYIPRNEIYIWMNSPEQYFPYNMLYK